MAKKVDGKPRDACDEMIDLVNEHVDNGDGVLQASRSKDGNGVAFIVDGSVVYYDAAVDGDDYKLAVLDDVVEMLASYRAVRSDALDAEALNGFVAFALVPVGGRGKYQVARLQIEGDKVVSAKRFDRHQPEMLHFALHKLFEAVRVEVERGYDETPAADETLTPVVDAPESKRAPAREKVREL